MLRYAKVATLLLQGTDLPHLYRHSKGLLSYSQLGMDSYGPKGCWADSGQAEAMDL